MALLDIAAIRAAQSPVAPTKPVTLPDGSTVTISRLSLGAKVDAGTLSTAHERIGAMLKAGVVAPVLSDSDIDALVNDPLLAPLAEAITTAINDFNQLTRPVQEVVDEAGKAFPVRDATEGDGPPRTGPV